MSQNLELRYCLREPIPEIFDAACYLDAAVSAHLIGKKKIAEELFELANCKVVWQWLDEVWGANSAYVQYRPIPDAPPTLPKALRVDERMPTAAEKKAIHDRDGYHCRFCGIPVIRRGVRQLISAQYPQRPCHGVKLTILSTPHFKPCGHNTIISYPMPEEETVRLITSF